MTRRIRKHLVVAILACLMPVAGFALTPYSQDFEGLDQADPDALANDGWLVFANVFGPDWGYWYGYGPFPAPNGGEAFSAIASGEGGADQGAQQLSVYSDYANTDHGEGAHIEANVFQEQTIGADDVTQTWIFDFQAKLGNLEGGTTALAFIKTLDPDDNFNMTNFITVDMTNIPDTWGDYTVSILIDDTLPGQILQFGFSNTASNYEGSGVFYDNINFYLEEPTATQSVTWGQIKALHR
ncbi:MAG: hypothetical protein GF355_17715 [Candidatus Eisenbacteria bacterium]|nr:hypothetical protein [Candidatus Eisenbacteria bacterium]